MNERELPLLRNTMRRNFKRNLPRKLELSTPDVHARVLVKRRAERDVLRLVLVSEEPFGRLVETFCDVVERIRRAVFGVSQFVWSRRSQLEFGTTAGKRRPQGTVGSCNSKT